MSEVTNLAALRNLAITTDTVYVKGHSTAGDGGGGIFLWRTETQFTTGDYSSENNGTIVKSSLVATDQGSWVRQYEGYINVLFFGAFGVGNDYTTAFQRAIDFASLNGKYNPALKGSTVFIPNGSYTLTNIVLKDGITIQGESISNTFIYSPGGTSSQYLFVIERGPVRIDISNLNIVGSNTEKGCFLFQSQSLATEPYHGGLWNSRISNIGISSFKGNAIYLQGGGGGSNYMLPNQFNIFENVNVTKTSHYTYALYMTGQNGQHTFINCTFDGFEINGTYAKGQNIRIQGSAVASFINCTCQNSDYGIFLEAAENITIDNCWFENLGVAITVKSNIVSGSNDVPCRGINIVNSHFANAAGFGSLNAPNNIKSGQCVSVSKSFVNVYGNFVIVSDPEGPYYNNNSSFLIAAFNTTCGVNVGNNVFQVPKLGKTSGIMQTISVVNNTINCYGNKVVFVNGSTSQITTIASSINAGELLNIRANISSITFKNSNNIVFQSSSQTLTLNNGENATFIKVDNLLGNNYETYQLISVMKSL